MTLEWEYLRSLDTFQADRDGYHCTVVIHMEGTHHRWKWTVYRQSTGAVLVSGVDNRPSHAMADAERMVDFEKAREAGV